MAKKKVRLNTPVGSLIYPYLIVPDAFKGEEKFKAKLRLNATEAADLVERIKKMLEAQKQKDTIMNDGDAYEYATEYLPFEEDGDDIILSASLKKIGNKGKPSQFEQRPAVFDGKNQKMTDPAIVIYSGSTGRLTVEPYTWSMDQKEGRGVGVSLRLKAAQVLTLAERAEPDADDYGFEQVEGALDSSELSPETGGEDF